MENRKWKTENANAVATKIAPILIWIILFSFFLFPFSMAAFAAPTQEEVLRSIGDNVGETVDMGKLLGVVIFVVALIIVVSVISQRRKRVIAPKQLNHQGKLIKEVARSINLRPVEIKQLKVLAESQELSSPLVLLLCPSLLTQAVKENSSKVDRKTIVSVARKISAQ